MPRKDNFWLGVAKSVLATLLVSAILGTAAAAGSIWIEVKMLRRDVDELRKDLDRLWVDVSDNVASLQGDGSPVSGFRPTSDQVRLAEAAEELRRRTEAAVAAAPASPP